MSRWFDPNKSFFELLIVRITFYFIISLSVVFFILITYNSDLSCDLTYNGFNYFIVVYKVPLGTLAILIPAIAVLATNHKSEQTKAQLKVATEQNNFVNYYKHLEEFEKYLNAHTDKSFFYHSINNLHGVLFHDAKDGIYSVGYRTIEYVNKSIGEFLYKVKSLDKASDDERLNILNDISSIQGDLVEYFNAGYQGSLQSMMSDGNCYLSLKNQSVGWLMNNYISFISELINLSGFDNKFLGFEYIEDLSLVRNCTFPNKYDPSKDNAWNALNLSPLLDKEVKP